MEIPIPIEVSARHIHITAEHFSKLFGAGAGLTWKSWLSQPGHFASQEQVTLQGPDGQIEAVTVLGPFRPETQIEISLTDARTLGIEAPIRFSGELEGSAGCLLVGPKGVVRLPQGIIVAKRHLHMTAKNAEMMQVRDGQEVLVRVDSIPRGLIFDHVTVRIDERFHLTMHIDTDEGNAAGCLPEGTFAYLLDTKNAIPLPHDCQQKKSILV